MLLETLVALSLVLVALLLVAGLLAMEIDVTAAGPAQREALSVLEGVLEELRVGARPLEATTLDEEDLPLQLARARNARLWLEVEPATVADLYQVRVRIRYLAGRRVVSRSLETLVWAPS